MSSINMKQLGVATLGGLIGGGNGPITFQNMGAAFVGGAVATLALEVLLAVVKKVVELFQKISPLVVAPQPIANPMMSHTKVIKSETNQT